MNFNDIGLRPIILFVTLTMILLAFARNDNYKRAKKLCLHRIVYGERHNYM